MHRSSLSAGMPLTFPCRSRNIGQLGQLGRGQGPREWAAPGQAQHRPAPQRPKRSTTHQGSVEHRHPVATRDPQQPAPQVRGGQRTPQQSAAPPTGRAPSANPLPKPCGSASTSSAEPYRSAATSASRIEAVVFPVPPLSPATVPSTCVTVERGCAHTRQGFLCRRGTCQRGGYPPSCRVGAVASSNSVAPSG